MEAARIGGKAVDAEGHFELCCRLFTPSAPDLPPGYDEMAELVTEQRELAWLAGHAAARAESEAEVAALKAKLAEAESDRSALRDRVEALTLEREAVRA